jgi:hypothetical protein
VFNFLLPGLGFHYTGTAHNVNWLRRLGLVTMVVFLLAFPIGVLLWWPNAHILYSFSIQELTAYLITVLALALVGAGIEQKIGGRVKP